MEIYPAVDILDGRCVQLVQGRPEAATVYGDPAAWAHRWLDQGADGLHVVNLDGAFGRARKNADLIRALTRETETFVELGGGIRSVEDAAGWLEAGVDRVIVSTQAVREPEIVRTLADEFGGERVMAGIDARAGEVMIEGWERPAGSYLAWAERFESLGAGSLLYTNVDVEGLQQGIAIEPVTELLRRVKVPVVVSGGISSPGDVAALREAGAAGAVLGSALYAGKVRLSEAMEAAHANE
ncbi:1-(5-phosphoribosyl)-5-[(5-phosphoribosylamino)methylideneamino] imidazole-4-carboxamide isomerase [Methanoculleus chikugoensis]|jgi:phosphoribosylformimino-5-aminoimidazole carboxamide ribotide isomerase|uniref:1-(5-phosphoribosyl)-5-[(5-phosphoribosylamino)methylideneamino] imidazole-4-carboxamide isomerase n=1 Tax=Methanoculleus chikugoensis TaxID=118126 RepID=A0A1M4MJQ3_9EURY|nr:1-(5-phosphoribosyl)-5-[(5-phosphoribosylamino)methylideneamino]imidazole-4-carboxamide isomerase [Methanoculleus chikugoensis]MDD4568222.1 1-(5-phosphoribosyl)-5-[(5-phosphoribosylamino)methylideneamino]imidazole-4-carboxamide isomerase [Methanoculleus chikugoensis]NMA09718.1 1-(5-phosphoribosyl)-5-[(5-phosphoribosylamino)methylideneamino]imidazole-4-carboxamide isomerase [Methanomicrobiales archaeon]SCL75096.1 1-(5-phosphoribosyl)-5-[(5-phosphoribosylamino)methylideneamino] imidazole-4-carb